jgi:cytochrome c556
MRKSPRHALPLVAIVAVLLVAWGCKNKSTPTQPAPPGGGPPSPQGGGETGTKQIMTRVAKGPNSLQEMIKKELQADAPDWATIQPQAAEYAKLATDFGKYDPPKGSKESWAKQTAAFADSATALDKAARAKDLSGTRAASEKLGGACMQCHREHRGAPGGFGPPGGRGGPPPGGRGGPPPG